MFFVSSLLVLIIIKNTYFIEFWCIIICFFLIEGPFSCFQNEDLSNSSEHLMNDYYMQRTICSGFICMVLFKPYINTLNKRVNWGLWSDLSGATQTKLKPRPGLYWSPGSWLPDDPTLTVPGFGSQQSIAPNTVIRGPRKAEALAVKTEMYLSRWPVPLTAASQALLALPQEQKPTTCEDLWGCRGVAGSGAGGPVLGLGLNEVVVPDETVASF